MSRVIAAYYELRVSGYWEKYSSGFKPQNPWGYVCKSYYCWNKLFPVWIWIHKNQVDIKEQIGDKGNIDYDDIPF